jgi:hypothetical protein
MLAEYPPPSINQPFVGVVSCALEGNCLSIKEGIKVISYAFQNESDRILSNTGLLLTAT